jgi:molecular chaperone DnaK (HSP70)
MGRLYVANCTKQPQELQYHLHLKVDGGRLVSTDAAPINRQATRQTIQPGRQDVIGAHDLPTWQIESVIRQLVPHGIVGVTDLYSPSFRAMKIPLLFSIDKPIPGDVIRYTIDSNSGVLTEQGRRRRIQAAIATNETINNAVAQSLATNQIDQEINTKVDVEFEQVAQSEFEETKIAQGVRIRDDAPGAPPPQPVKRRAPPRKAA